MVVPARNPPADSPLEGVSDRELVAQVQAGDTATFAELFLRYHVRLCTYLTRLTGSDDLGCDFAQETFSKALDTLLVKQDEIVYFKSWLYSIGVNIIRDYWRRTRIIRWVRWPQVLRREFDTDERLDGSSSEVHAESREFTSMALAGPEEQVEEAEMVKMALAQVSVKYRPCLLLHIVEELSHHEIAQILHISERSVRRYLKRGYDELCEAYQHLEDQQGSVLKRRSTR